MSIHQHGFWVGVDASSQHIYDNKLSNELVNFFKSEKAASIVDLGCGMGDYVKHFKNNDLQADGFDGNPYTPELTHNICGVLDLSTPHIFTTPYEWVMSLEVGEHLPAQYEDIFIQNLHNNNTKGIVLSWAVIGQGGYGHFNEQSNQYIKNKICALGYINDVGVENTLRSKSSLSWFKNTIMVFRKK